MKKFRMSLLIFVCIVLCPAMVTATDIYYSDFFDLSAFTLGVRAAELNAVPDGTLHLISGIWQRNGYAILTNPVHLSDSFSTHFCFRIYNNIAGGADWLVFNIQTDDELTSGNAVTVEFDIFNNGSRDNYSGNHIGLNINHDFSSSIVQTVSPDFNNEEIWHAWIDYDGNLINVYASTSSEKPDTPYISQELDVLSILGTSDVYLGFHAASGAYGADFDVLNWSFNSPQGICVSEDTMPPAGAVHAYPNVIWPPNKKKVKITLEGHVMDEMSVAREGDGHGVSSAYLLIDNADKIILLDDTTNLLGADGHFSVEINVKAIKGAEYLIELFAADTNPDEPNSGLVDTTYIRVPKNMN